MNLPTVNTFKQNHSGYKVERLLGFVKMARLMKQKQTEFDIKYCIHPIKHPCSYNGPFNVLKKIYYKNPS